MPKETDVRLGVRDAWDFWFSQTPISTPRFIAEAIKEVFKEWLDAHEEEIITAIAEQAKGKGI